jgi:hypothetical protein
VLTEIDHGTFRATVTVDTGPFAGKVEGTGNLTVRK